MLCGSVASFMINKVVKSKALYGRVHLSIHLKPFKLDQSKLFFPGRSASEILQAQLLVGGIPTYLKLLASKPSVFPSIQELAFEEHGYFTTEFDKIFISQFGSSSNYEELVRLLGEHPYGLTRQQIINRSHFSNGGKLTSALKDLEVAGIISSYSPFHLGAKTKAKIFIVSDPYIRLYLSFIEKALPQIADGKPNIFVN